jgi:hypothetical protein
MCVPERDLPRLGAKGLPAFPNVPASWEGSRADSATAAQSQQVPSSVGLSEMCNQRNLLPCRTLRPLHHQSYKGHTSHNDALQEGAQVMRIAFENFVDQGGSGKYALAIVLRTAWTPSPSCA